ncbi:MAG TPA: hypothetical protein VJC11_03425 [Patescibacteria group bacterium]|nr:hypothetical protein [Patescibacteria group bacterium]
MEKNEIQNEAAKQDSSVKGFLEHEANKDKPVEYSVLPRISCIIGLLIALISLIFPVIVLFFIALPFIALLFISGSSIGLILGIAALFAEKRSFILCILGILLNLGGLVWYGFWFFSSEHIRLGNPGCFLFC